MDKKKENKLELKLEEMKKELTSHQQMCLRCEGAIMMLNELIEDK